GLEFQFSRKRRHRHAPRGIATLGASAGVADVFHVRICGASDRLFRFAVPPAVSDHAMGGGECSGGNGSVTGAGFRSGIGIGGVAEPRALVDEAPEAAGPLETEFVDIISAHLIRSEEHTSELQSPCNLVC